MPEGHLNGRSDRLANVKRRSLLAAAVALSAAPLRLASSQSRAIARIGWVTAQQASSLTPYVEAFRSGLADLGYIEGRNLALVLRYGDDHLDRVRELAAELVRVPVDVIVAQGAATFLISKAKLPVPIVYAFSGDPVIAGFADGRPATCKYDRADLHGAGAHRNAISMSDTAQKPVRPAQDVVTLARLI